jgi:hypothetical protein
MEANGEAANSSLALTQLHLLGPARSAQCKPRSHHILVERDPTLEDGLADWKMFIPPPNDALYHPIDSAPHPMLLRLSPAQALHRPQSMWSS